MSRNEASDPPSGAEAAATSELIWHRAAALDELAEALAEALDFEGPSLLDIIADPGLV